MDQKDSQLADRPPAHLPRLQAGPWAGQCYLPLEFWRRPEAWRLFQGQPEVRRFRSSGTTGAARSTSRFSAAGLEAYRGQSVAHFLAVLSQVLPPPASGGPLDQVHGISLVPPVAEWPDSSLAQMVEWIGATLPVSYCDSGSLAAAIASHSGRPVWLFGTAFHLLNAIDGGYAGKLPAGSVIIETGGTKGQSREVTRAELYHDLQASFGIPEAAIISEYGMCELACQAYDYLPHGTARELEQRRFRFPSWVQLGVVTAPGVQAAKGRGALMIHDPLRLDAPWPLRTEDLAEVEGDTFQLLGRAPSQPLKGCSLRVEDLGQRDAGTSVSRSVGGHAAAVLLPKAAAIASRIPSLAAALQRFLQRAETLHTLTAELGSAAAAETALADVRSGLPPTAEAWLQAALEATAHQPIAHSWLFILPANHSIVGLYPLALAYALNLKITVRLPRRFADGKNLLKDYISVLQALPEAAITSAPPHLRLGESSLTATAVLAYGSDETLATLRGLAGVPVQGFGGRVGVSLIDEAEWSTAAAPLARDLFSLGQTGCMATRLVLASGEARSTAAQLSELLAASGRDFWQTSLPWRDQVGLDFEAVRLGALGAFVRRPQADNEPLVAVYELAAGENLTDQLIDAWMARAPFTTVVLRLRTMPMANKVSSMLSFLERRGSLGTVTASARMLNTCHPACGLRALGTANQQVWSGSHENRPLFAGFGAKFL